MDQLFIWYGRGLNNCSEGSLFPCLEVFCPLACLVIAPHLSFLLEASLMSPVVLAPSPFSCTYDTFPCVVLIPVSPTLGKPVSFVCGIPHLRPGSKMLVEHPAQHFCEDLLPSSSPCSVALHSCLFYHSWAHNQQTQMWSVMHGREWSPTCP